jgi:NTE family protein
VLAVDISAQPKYQSTDSIPEVMLQSFAILGKRLGEVELAAADIAIRPAVGDLGSASFEARERSYVAGQQAAREVMKKLLADLA